MPSLSPTMEEGNLAKWLKKEGDKISLGDIIAEVETDKATMEVEATDEGILGKILVLQGTQNVKVNSPIAILLKKGEDKSLLDSFNLPGSSPARSSSSSSASSNLSSSSSSSVASIGLSGNPSINLGGNNRIIASPLAKNIAKNESVDLSKVNGTGPYGRIVKEDVLNACASGGVSLASKGSCNKSGGEIVKSCGRDMQEFTKVPHTSIRKTIAKRLLESKTTVPHFYLNVDCNVDELLAIREQMNKIAPKKDGKEEYKISVNDFVIKACAVALKKIPQANASWSDDATIIYNNVDISVAVSTDTGLITPIVKNADKKTLSDISNEMKMLAKKARENKLQPAEYVGGGFSISNLGMYGIKNFQAIVNPPQGAILAVGATEKKPVVDEKNNIKISNIMNITISCDHRIIDGALAAVLLCEIKNYLEKPYLMIV